MYSRESFFPVMSQRSLHANIRQSSATGCRNIDRFLDELLITPSCSTRSRICVEVKLMRHCDTVTLFKSTGILSMRECIQMDRISLFKVSKSSNVLAVGSRTVEVMLLKRNCRVSVSTGKIIEEEAHREEIRSPPESSPDGILKVCIC